MVFAFPLVIGVLFISKNIITITDPISNSVFESIISWSVILAFHLFSD